ncbi:hypothetical protein M422DRAFT_276049 [Sphaerobolus stellatus SS14]|uniref:Uncharacterized protein n=1 Tax=Sphaerobolus stellatus (strain SS14) TaxID=990650 RepID=A0A0C9UE19_SPHS4|nr:hypothetical protein M422DRAFT_276049 [Sphaerobolus stellatus SS14]
MVINYAEITEQNGTIVCLYQEKAYDKIRHDFLWASLEKSIRLDHTGDAADSNSTSSVIGGNDPTLDPGKDPSQTVSAISETNIIHPMTWNTCVNNLLTKTTPKQTGRDGYLPLGKSSDDPEPSEQPDSADPDPEELVLGNQIQEMLDTINEHMDEVQSIYNMSCQVAQLLEKTNESNNALDARTRTLRT